VLEQLDVRTDVPFLLTVAGAAVSVQTGALTNTPVPLRETRCGLVGDELLTVTVPVFAPIVVGPNVTLRSQEPPPIKPLPQLLLTAKSPLAVTLVILMVWLPVFVSVDVSGALVLFTS
jgi:hypothetical protein